MNDPISPPQVPPIPLVPAEMLHSLTVAHAEIASLRLAIRRLAEQDATLSVCDGNVTVTMDATLTDAEREALERICEAADDIIDEDKRANGVYWQDDAAAVAVVRGLLERLGGGR